MNFFKRHNQHCTQAEENGYLLTLIFVLSNIIAGAISVKNALVNTETPSLIKWASR